MRVKNNATLCDRVNVVVGNVFAEWKVDVNGLTRSKGHWTYVYLPSARKWGDIETREARPVIGKGTTMKRLASLILGLILGACTGGGAASECQFDPPVCVQTCGSDDEVPANCGTDGAWRCEEGVEADLCEGEPIVCIDACETAAPVDATCVGGAWACGDGGRGLPGLRRRARRLPRRLRDRRDDRRGRVVTLLINSERPGR